MNIFCANLVSLSGIRKGMFELHDTVHKVLREGFGMGPGSGQAPSVSDALSRFSYFDFQLGG